MFEKALPGRIGVFLGPTLGEDVVITGIIGCMANSPQLLFQPFHQAPK